MTPLFSKRLHESAAKVMYFFYILKDSDIFFINFIFT